MRGGGGGGGEVMGEQGRGVGSRRGREDGGDGGEG